MAKGATEVQSQCFANQGECALVLSNSGESEDHLEVFMSICLETGLSSAWVDLEVAVETS